MQNWGKNMSLRSKGQNKVKLLYSRKLRDYLWGQSEKSLKKVVEKFGY